jgi:hypothetical protein
VLNRDDSKITFEWLLFYLVTFKPLSPSLGLFLAYMLGQYYPLYYESMFVVYVFFIKKIIIIIKKGG